MAAKSKVEVKSCVQGLQEPKTLAELREQLNLDPLELERLLEELLEEETIVCKTLSQNDQCPTRLYWKDTKPSLDATPIHKQSFMKPGANFQSPSARIIKKPSPRARLPFKSPVSTKTPAKHETAATNNETLKQELSEITREITELRKCYDVRELDECIDALHTYNELKDAGQMLLGQLAVLEGVTTAQLYSRYELNLDS